MSTPFTITRDQNVGVRDEACGRAMVKGIRESADAREVLHEMPDTGLYRHVKRGN